MGEKIVVVDKDDNFVMEEDKAKCHKGEGILHRAFSVFIFNDKNELLVQKRSRFKQLWPLHWSNSCCSHPRKGESYEDAAQRRVKEELGIDCKTRLLFKFQYKAGYKDIGSENELCAVLASKCGRDSKINIDPKEVAEYRFADVDELRKDMEENTGSYTPWFRMELKRVLDNIGMGGKN